MHSAETQFVPLVPSESVSDAGGLYLRSALQGLVAGSGSIEKMVKRGAWR
jgi:hypothetical protein